MKISRFAILEVGNAGMVPMNSSTYGILPVVFKTIQDFNSHRLQVLHSTVHTSPYNVKQGLHINTCTEGQVANFTCSL